MKAPALRVILAMIQSKANQVQREFSQAYEASEKARTEYIAAANDKLWAKVSKKPSLYFDIVQRRPGAFPHVEPNEALGLMKKEIEDAAPKVISRSTETIYISSLDVSFYVPVTHADKWKAFAKECDAAFLDDNAKAIVEALSKV